MLPREFTRLVEAHNERQEAKAEIGKANDRAAWERSLLIANHIRSFAGDDPLTFDDIKEGGAEPPSREEFLEAKRKREERRKG